MNPIDELKEAFAGNEHALALIQNELWGRLGEYAEDHGTERQQKAWRHAEAHLRQKATL